VFKRLRTNNDLSAEDRSWLAKFVALQEARSQLLRTRAERFLERQFDILRQRAEAAGMDPIVVQSEYVRRRIFPNDALPTATNLSLLALDWGMEANVPLYLAMNKCILTSERRSFVTSFHPVVWVDVRNPFPEKPHPVRAAVSAEVTFPLTKRHCLLMAYMPIRATAIADDAQVRTINARTALRSREVFAPPLIEAEQEELIVDLSDPTAIPETLCIAHHDPAGQAIDMRPFLFHHGSTREEVDELFAIANWTPDKGGERPEASIPSLKLLLAEIAAANSSED
jgi:hypothetical protein